MQLLAHAPTLSRPCRLLDVDHLTRRWRRVGAVAGLLAAGVTLAGAASQDGPMGPAPVLALQLAALGIIAGVVAGELRVRPPRGSVRIADLEVRSVRTYLPRVLTATVGSCSAAFAALAVGAGAMAAPDDLGRPGRVLVRVCAWRRAAWSGSRPGPGRGPGSGYPPAVPALTVDTTDPTPPYEQLRRQLVALVAVGSLRDGDRLPPVRQLASDLGLAAGTVARAYRELEAAGVVVTRRGGGSRVRATAAAPTRAQLLDAYARELVHRARLVGATDADVRAAVERSLSPAVSPRRSPAGRAG